MPDGAPQGRIPELDGLRGMAILAVWLGHYFAAPGEGSVWFLSGYWFRLGWTGVDLFFVLSGFLIGGILLDVRESPTYFQTFYARRLFRIIPLYYAWIAAYILLAAFAGHYVVEHIGSLESVDVPILSHFLFWQNFSRPLAPAVAFWWFNSTWSLAVEEQFYLVAPVVVRYLSKRALTVFLIAATIGAPIVRLLVRSHFESGPLLAFRLMPCRADSLAIGMLAAVAWRSPTVRARLSVHGVMLYGPFGILLAGVAWIWRYSPDPLFPLTQVFGYTWLALFFAVLMFAAISKPAGPLAVVARLKLFRELGGVSYCIYIIHTSVFLFCHRILLHSLPSVTNGRVAIVTLLAAGITCAIAKLSWRFFEEPLLRRGHAFKY